MKDNHRRIPEVALSDGAVFEIDFSKASEYAAQLSEPEHGLLQLFDGRRSVLQVVDDSELESLRARQLIVRFCSVGLLQKKGALASARAMAVTHTGATKSESGLVSVGEMPTPVPPPNPLGVERLRKGAARMQGSISTKGEASSKSPSRSSTSQTLLHGKAQPMQHSRTSDTMPFASPSSLSQTLVQGRVSMPSPAAGVDDGAPLLSRTLRPGEVKARSADPKRGETLVEGAPESPRHWPAEDSTDKSPLAQTLAGPLDLAPGVGKAIGSSHRESPDGHVGAPGSVAERDLAEKANRVPIRQARRSAPRRGPARAEQDRLPYEEIERADGAADASASARGGLFIGLLLLIGSLLIPVIYFLATRPAARSGIESPRQSLVAGIAQ